MDKISKEKIKLMIEARKKGMSLKEISLAFDIKEWKAKYYVKGIRLTKEQIVLNINKAKRKENIRRHENCCLCGKEYPKSQKRKGKYCNTCVSKIRRFVYKTKAIELKGGQCEKCGYKFNKTNFAAFEFHHIQGDKNFAIGDGSNRKWEETKKEIEKCSLLCSNCHRIEHSDYENEDLLKISEVYLQAWANG
jgi:hypothetical protein